MLPFTRPLRASAADLARLGVVAPSLRRPQIVANRGQVPTNYYGNGLNGRSDTRLEGRAKCKFGPSDVSQVQFAFANCYINGGGGGEGFSANDLTVEAALEKVAAAPDPAVVHRMTFGGAVSATLAPGLPLRLTDPLAGVRIPAGGTAFARFGLTVASGTMYIPGGTFPNANGVDEGGAISSSGSSQVMTTGVMTNPSGGIGGLFALPLAVIGIPARSHPSVVVLGHSGEHGLNDYATNPTGDGAGNLGYAGRGLANVTWGGQTGVQIPYVRTTQGGDTLAKNLGDAIRKRAVWPYATHLLMGCLSNDILAGTSLATIQSYLLSIWASAKATIGPYGKPMQIAQILSLPKTSSTDSWATAVNQTYYANFEPGGLKDQLHAWIRSKVGAADGPDAVIDLAPYLEDPAAPGKWVSNGTANYATNDGQHPSGPRHIAASEGVRAWAATLTI